MFGTRTAVDEQRENPALAATIRQSSQIYDRIPLRDFISDASRSELGREMYLEINRICNATQPTIVCREKYAAAMLVMASYQVLMIPAPPQQDDSGLRGQPGITGEMNSYIVDLFKKNDALRAAMYGESEMIEYDDYWQLVQRLFWESYWQLETLHAARSALGDIGEGDDWNDAFLHAACANAEHTFRWNLDLPPAFDEDIAKEASNAYSMFTDIVMSGAEDPAAEWRDYYQDSGIPMPDILRQ